MGQHDDGSCHLSGGSGMACRRILLIALCLVLVTTWTMEPTLTRAQITQGNQGTQGGWAVNDQGQTLFAHALSTQFVDMKDAGAGWVRINFRLGSCFKDW